MMRKERRYLSLEELEARSKRIVSLKDYITKKNARALDYQGSSKQSKKGEDGNLDKLLKDNETRLSIELAQDAAEELEEQAKSMAIASREAELAFESRRHESRIKERERQRMRELQVKARQDWFQGNGWMDKENRINLAKIGAHLNSERERLIKLEDTLLKLKRRVKMKGEAYELLYRWNESQSGETKRRSIRPTFNLGGNCTIPKMFVLSYPGSERDILFKTLRSMHIDLGEEGDVHVMNDEQKDAGLRGVPLPHQWFELFNGNEWFKDFLLYLTQDTKSKEYLAPEWFVRNWAEAALHAASNSPKTGAGIIVLDSWEGYKSSPWCEMEFLFCKIVASYYPRSVYVVSGHNDSPADPIGYYLELSSASKHED